MGLIFSCPGIPAFCGRGRRGSQRRWTVRWLIGRKAGCKDRERERACNLSSRADFFCVWGDRRAGRPGCIPGGGQGIPSFPAAVFFRLDACPAFGFLFIQAVWRLCCFPVAFWPGGGSRR